MGFGKFNIFLKLFGKIPGNYLQGESPQKKKTRKKNGEPCGFAAKCEPRGCFPGRNKYTFIGEKAITKFFGFVAIPISWNGPQAFAITHPVYREKDN